MHRQSALRVVHPGCSSSSNRSATVGSWQSPQTQAHGGWAAGQGLVPVGCLKGVSVYKTLASPEITGVEVRDSSVAGPGAIRQELAQQGPRVVQSLASGSEAQCSAGSCRRDSGCNDQSSLFTDESTSAHRRDGNCAHAAHRH